MLKVGLIGNGGREWMAGVLYQQSLLAGNQLLSEKERADFAIFLHHEYHDVRDYGEVDQMYTHIETFDFYYGKPVPFLHKNYQFLNNIRRGKLQWPKDRLPSRLAEQKIEVIFPANELLVKDSPVRQVCWIPDFQHVYFPQFFSRRESGYRNRLLRRMSRLADLLIVSNDFSRADAIRIAPEIEPKIKVLPFTMWLGDDWQTADFRDYVKKHQLPDKFLIFPSQWWVHKNHRLLFEAINLVKRAGLADIALVCTGLAHDRRFPRYAEELNAYIRDYGLEDNIFALNYLPRQEQVQLMRAACAVVQPSLFEGWSAIVEDARSLGKTILASDIPMHHEHGEEDIYFFNPNSVAELADRILKLWPVLTPGTPPLKEAKAKDAYEKNLKLFSKNFIDLCQYI